MYARLSLTPVRSFWRIGGTYLTVLVKKRAYDKALRNFLAVKGLVIISLSLWQFQPSVSSWQLITVIIPLDSNFLGGCISRTALKFEKNINLD